MLRTDNQITGVLQLIGKPFFYLLQAGVFVIFVGFRLVVSTASRAKSLLGKLAQPPRKQPKIKPSKSAKPPQSKIPTFAPISLTITISKGFLIFIGLTSFLSTFIYLAVLKDLPSPQQLKNFDPATTTKIYDRNGQLLYKVYQNENRTIVNLDEIPAHVINATIAIEDSDFYQHTGISIRGIGRALKRNIFEDRSQGGSTITQQLVKNTLLTPEKTLLRKIKEVILAIGVEITFTKNQILAMYFNQVGYGGAIYGIEEASQYYFAKSVKDLSLAEAALLAGLPQAPTTYSPFGAQPELAIVRQHEVLRRMVEDRYLTNSQAEAAKAEKLKFATPRNNIHAPHFVMLVKDLLVKTFGETQTYQGGLNVTTTIDLNIQHQAEQAVREELAKINRLNVTNAAVLVTKPQTGEILAMVGSVDYYDVEHDGQVNVAIRPRQPGSSIKPLTYALALESGMNPGTIIEDSPITYRLPGSPPYSPVNYDGRFHGRVTLRQALANSYNVPAVKILSQMGVNQLVRKGQQMGITTWHDPSRFGLSLTLGGGEVKMVDMATAYGVFANQGTRVNLSPLLTVANQKGESLYHSPCLILNSDGSQSNKKCQTQKVLRPEVTYQISDILSDNRARSAVFGTNSQLNIPGHQVAVKTGTTNSLRDNWTIGYTNDYVVAVWVGNNDNTPMSGVASGITGATPIWRKVMAKLIENKPPHRFNPPDNLIKVLICPLTQTKSCSSCPNPVEEYFMKGQEPEAACTPEMIHQRLNPPVDNLPRDQILQGFSTRE